MTDLIVSVECGEKFCGECEFLWDLRGKKDDHPACLLLSRPAIILKHRGKNVYRYPGCITAEKEAKKAMK